MFDQWFSLVKNRAAQNFHLRIYVLLQPCLRDSDCVIFPPFSPSTLAVFPLRGSLLGIFDGGPERSVNGIRYSWACL